MLSLVPPDDCLRARESLSAQIDGELSELESVRLAAHLRGCAECRAYAPDVAAATALLRAAALELPGIEIALPSRRRLPGLQVAAAAAAAVAVAAGSSFALGRALGTSSGPASVGTPAAADLLGLRSDSTQQHVLAMLARVHPGTPNFGRVIPL